MSPTLYIYEYSSVIKRSTLFSLSTLTYFVCNQNYTQQFSWSLKSFNTTLYINLTSNPSWQSSELVMQSNSLEYGLYEATINTQIKLENSNSVFANNKSITFQIIPTGINVYGLPNGVQSILIGSNQSFSLNPRKHSVDLDSLISPSNLTFKFYCVTKFSNYSSSIDLLTYKMNSSLPMNSNQTCFDSNSKFFYFFIF